LTRRKRKRSSERRYRDAHLSAEARFESQFVCESKALALGAVLSGGHKSQLDDRLGIDGVKASPNQQIAFFFSEERTGLTGRLLRRVLIADAIRQCELFPGWEDLDLA
jgi:hypothetical protein